MKYLKYFLLFLLLLLIIFFGRGLLTPSVSYESEITVDKDIKETWAVMADESRMPEWIEGFVKSELVSGTPYTVGAVSNFYINQGGQETIMKGTVKSAKVNDHFTMLYSMGFMDMEYGMNLEEKGDQTVIKSISTTKGNGLFAKSILSFMGKGMKAQEDKNLASLKNVIQTNTKDYFPEAIIQTSDGVIIEN